MKTKTLIVSRHPAAVEFIRLTDPRFTHAPVVEHASASTLVGVKLVAGNLPVHLAAIADEYVSVVVPMIPEDMRGRDLSGREMAQLGAKLFCCCVTGLRR